MGKEYEIRVSDERPDEPAVDLMVHLIVLMGRQLQAEAGHAETDPAPDGVTNEGLVEGEPPAAPEA